MRIYAQSTMRENAVDRYNASREKPCNVGSTEWCAAGCKLAGTIGSRKAAYQAGILKQMRNENAGYEYPDPLSQPIHLSIADHYSAHSHILHRIGLSDKENVSFFRNTKWNPTQSRTYYRRINRLPVVPSRWIPLPHQVLSLLPIGIHQLSNADPPKALCARN